MAKAAPKRKAANGYKLPDPLPKGEILEDVAKKSWKLGPSIGQGGFGEIYSAQEAGVSGSQYPYVIKIEPHANGPLFVERKFYITNAKPADVEAFRKEKGLKTFGMPSYLGSGTHECKGEKYRFLVMDKFGTDLWKIFLENNKTLPSSTVFKLAVQILDVLEYIHKCGYIHADIKGANVLLGISKETNNKQVYLVDFGLATKFTEDSEYKPNPKKAHDGTLEYLSRDAHQGVQTRRGDLEILAYNLIQWLGCKLPWENLKTPKDVQQSKEQYMKDIPKLIRTCFEKRTPPGPLVDFLNYIISLDFNKQPDYKKLRKIFLSGLDPGDSLNKPFQFATNKNATQTTPKRKKKTAGSPPKKKKVSENEKENLHMDIDEDDDSVGMDKDNEVPDVKPIAKKDKEESIETQGRGRGRARKPVNYNEDSDDGKKKTTRAKKVTKTATKDTNGTVDEYAGFTSAMKEVMMKKKQKKQKKENIKKNGVDKEVKTVEADNSDNMNGYNSEMKEIATKMSSKRTRTVRKPIIDDEKNSDDDDTKGYNNEMKEVAAKTKVNNKKRRVNKDSEPSTSRNSPNKKQTAYNRPMPVYSDSD